jgi:multiple sugar transport system permease protein
VGFLTLWGVGFLTLVLGSMVASFVLGLAEWSPLRSPDDLRWVGLGNFSRLFEDDTFGDSLRVTLLYTVVSVPATLVFALGIAMLLDRPFRGVNLARTVIYLPALVSPVVVAAVWKWLLDSERGALNAALWWLGIEGPPWLSSETWVLPAFVLMGLWQVGAQTLVFLAGLQGQDRTLLDAARMDGASAWRRFWHVTLPGLGPVVLFNVVMGTITAFQIFAQPFVMTQGEPGNASRFLSLYIYETAFHHLAMGYASAIAWVMFIVLFVLTLLTLAFGKRFVHYAGGR